MRTTPGATAVQVVWSSRRGSRQIEHLGSAHDEAELETLKAAAQQRIAAGQLELDMCLDCPGAAGPLPIRSSRMSNLGDALERGYRVLGFEDAAGGDDVFRNLALARIIEPSSKLDSLRVSRRPGRARVLPHPEAAHAGLCAGLLAPGSVTGPAAYARPVCPGNRSRAFSCCDYQATALVARPFYGREVGHLSAIDLLKICAGFREGAYLSAGPVWHAVVTPLVGNLVRQLP